MSLLNKICLILLFACIPIAFVGANIPAIIGSVLLGAGVVAEYSRREKEQK